MEAVSIKLKIILILFLLCLFLPLGIIKAETQSDDTIQVLLSATEYDYEPFSVTSEGKADGFSVELLRAVAEEMGYDIVFEIDQWSVIKESLKNKELDVLPLVGYTEERDTYFDFTVPYIVMRGNIFIRKDDQSIQSQEDLFGKEILVLEGDNSEEWALSIGLDEEITSVSTYTEAFLLLNSGQYDAVLANGVVGEKIISDNQFDLIEAVYIYDDDGITRYKLYLEGYEQKFCFAVSEGDAELLSKLNEGLAIVSQNGTYDELYQKWFPFLIEEDTLTTLDILWKMLPILIPSLIILLLVFIFLLRSQIRVKSSELERFYKHNQIILEAFKKDFQEQEDSFLYILDELCQIADVKSGLLFSIDEYESIHLRSSTFTSINKNLIISELYRMIQQPEFKNRLLENTPISMIGKSPEDSILLEIFPEQENYLFTSIPGHSQKHVAILFNLKRPYEEKESHQITILLSGLRNYIEQHDKRQRDEYLSYHDELTGLYNRRFFDEELKRLDNNLKLPLSIVMGDVNELKRVNDLLGHTHGDTLLQSVGNIIRSETRSTDICARWGGDEFAIILPQTSSIQVQDILKQIETALVRSVDAPFQLSVAFGYATKTEMNESIQEVFIRAEEHMYVVKQQSRES